MNRNDAVITASVVARKGDVNRNSNVRIVSATSSSPVRPTTRGIAIVAAHTGGVNRNGSQNIRAISVKRVNENNNEVVVELDFVPGLAPHLHGFALQVNGLTAGYDGTGPSNLYEVLQAAGVDERLLTREDIMRKDSKAIPLHLEREVKQYGELQFA